MEQVHASSWTRTSVLSIKSREPSSTARVRTKDEEGKCSPTELCLHASEWRGLHPRPRSPGLRALLLSYTQKDFSSG